MTNARRFIEKYGKAGVHFHTKDIKVILNSWGTDDTLANQTIQKALDSGSLSDKIEALQHKRAKPEHISQGLKHIDPYVRRAAISNENATPEHIDEALDDFNGESSWEVRFAAAKHDNATRDNVAKGLNDPNYRVREGAALNFNISDEHLSKALGDFREPESYFVRAAAASNFHAKPYHINAALDDPHYGVRVAAAHNVNISDAQTSRALKDVNGPNAWKVRLAAVENSRNEKHLNAALDDFYDEHSWKVRLAAIEHGYAHSEQFYKAEDDPDSRVSDFARDAIENHYN